MLISSPNTNLFALLYWLLLPTFIFVGFIVYKVAPKRHIRWRYYVVFISIFILSYSLSVSFSNDYIDWVLFLAFLYFLSEIFWGHKDTKSKFLLKVGGATKYLLILFSICWIFSGWGLAFGFPKSKLLKEYNFDDINFRIIEWNSINYFSYGKTYYLSKRYIKFPYFEERQKLFHAGKKFNDATLGFKLTKEDKYILIGIYKNNDLIRDLRITN